MGVYTLRTIIPEVPKKQRYWFVRTDGGAHYSDFTMHDYIAIAWDYISIEMFTTRNADTVKKIILNAEKSTPTEDEESDIGSSELAKETTIYNKINRFINEMSIGDIVLCPSKNSSSISLGKIKSTVYEDSHYAIDYYNGNPDSELNVCPYYKRRKVEWIKTINRENLDIYLSRALSSQHSVSCLDEHALLINRSLYDMYNRGETTHLTLRTCRPESITFAELKDLVDTLDRNLKSTSEALNIQYNPSALEVKLSIHSPGLIEIAGSVLMLSGAASFLLLALNHFRHGGKNNAHFKMNFGKLSIEYSNESESRGTRDFELDEQRLDIEAIERLSSLQDKLEIKFPEIPEVDESSIPSEDSVDN